MTALRVFTWLVVVALSLGMILRWIIIVRRAFREPDNSLPAVHSTQVTEKLEDQPVNVA